MFGSNSIPGDMILEEDRLKAHGFWRCFFFTKETRDNLVTSESI